MTIIADEKEFLNEFDTLINMVQTHRIMIRREDGVIFSLNEVKDYTTRQVEKVE